MWEVHQADKEYCSVWEDADLWKRVDGQRVISPLHGPSRDNVKQGKTWGNREGKTIKEEQGVRERYIRGVVMAAAAVTATIRAMLGERYTKWRTSR